MLARLVVLPEPVGPVTRIRPRGRVMSRLIASGMPSCSKVMNSFGMRRITMPMLPRCLNTAVRKRKPSTNSMAKSVPPFSCNSCWQRSGVIDFIRAVQSSLSSTLVSMSRTRPPFLSAGGLPTVMNRSAAFTWMTVCSSLSIWTWPATG